MVFPPIGTQPGFTRLILTDIIPANTVWVITGQRKDSAMTKEISTAAIIGLGALGTMYAERLSRAMKKDSFFVIATKDRIARIKREGVYVNGHPLDLTFRTPEEKQPVDLILFATKYHDLPIAIIDAAPFVGPDTLIISVLNGISSEEQLIDAFGADRVLYCVVWGMSAVKLGNNLECPDIGTIAVGETGSPLSPRLFELADFLTKAGLTVNTPPDIRLLQWSKLMLNAGINQVTAAYDCTYAQVQVEGEPRRVMLAAMREVLTLANLERIPLTKDDIEKWMAVVDSLEPSGFTSMRQDLLAGRKTELELFAGTVIKLGQKHKIETPVNSFLHARITELERKNSVK